VFAFVTLSVIYFVVRGYCYDRNHRTSNAQSFKLWQQATV